MWSDLVVVDGGGGTRGRRASLWVVDQLWGVSTYSLHSFKVWPRPAGLLDSYGTIVGGTITISRKCMHTSQHVTHITRAYVRVLFWYLGVVVLLLQQQQHGRESLPEGGLLR